VSSERRLILEKIADEAGVSVRTVQRVLSNALKESRPSAAARASAIRAIATRYGYLPNHAAKAVRTGRFGAVALLSSADPTRKVLFPGMLWALQSGLRERGVHLILAQMPEGEVSRTEDLPVFLRQASVDGLLVYHNRSVPAGLIRAIRGCRLPTVWVNIKRGADCVYPDDFDAAKRATELLIDHGHREIAMLSFATGDHYSRADREKGYKQALASYALKPRIERVTPANLPMGDRAAAAAAWLKKRRATGVVCYEQRDAMPLLTAALRLGLRVPGDLSVVCMHDAEADLAGITIDTLQIPTERMGQAAVEMLDAKIEDQAAPLSPRVLGFEHRRGATVGQPLTP